MPRSTPIETESEVVPCATRARWRCPPLLWEQTTVGQSWIAHRLRMGTAANVSQQIRRAKRQKNRAKLAKELRAYLGK